MSEALELGLVRRANEAYEASEERCVPTIRREVTYYLLWIIDSFFSFFFLPKNVRISTINVYFSLVCL